LQNESEHDDGSLILRVAEGDVAAYRELVRRHGSSLYHFAVRLTRDSAESEDIVQETFLRLWQRAKDYSPEARVTTWLHRITHNLAVDRLRARGRAEPLSDDEEVPISARQHADLEGQRSREALEAALAHLPERQAAAIALVNFQGLSGREAASVLGVKEEALESLLARGRRTLKTLLSKSLGINFGETG
jgi:RNA polymerase sigma-70 factor (ECF subfamily)